jgi:hypothetical protein
MKILIVIGALLIITSATSASTTGVSGGWMLQSGLIFLLGALAVSAKEKSWGKEILSLAVVLMVALFLWGFVNGMWHAHPLGAIISIAGGGWAIYLITKDKEQMREGSRTLFFQEFSQKLLQNVKQHIKWIGVPLSILFVLWLSKSILIAFVVGFGVTAFLDKQSIQTKGLNRVAIILLLYTVGFLLLLAGIFKIEDAYFYGDFFFLSRDSYIFLRDIMSAL